MVPFGFYRLRRESVLEQFVVHWTASRFVNRVFSTFEVTGIFYTCLQWFFYIDFNETTGLI